MDDIYYPLLFDYLVAFWAVWINPRLVDRCCAPILYSNLSCSQAQIVITHHLRISICGSAGEGFEMRHLGFLHCASTEYGKTIRAIHSPERS